MVHGLHANLVSGLWIGGDDRDIHFDSMSMGQGATMALPVWAYYMRKVFNDKQLGYSEGALFDLPKDYDPCSMGGTEGDDPNLDALDISDIYE